MSATKLGDITLTKQTGTVLTLSTERKYVDNDVFFDIDVQSGAGTVTIASTDASIEPDVSGRNISESIGAKSSSAPSSGYYFKVDASGTGSSAVTTAGWLNTGSIGTASATGSFYFPVDTATASVTGTNTLTPSASVSGTNVTLSNTNNGISIVASGGGSASASISMVGNQSGYVGSGDNLGTSTVPSSTESTTASAFISGVTLNKPSSGVNSFSITVPNGNSMATFTFNVDSTGNVTIS